MQIDGDLIRRAQLLTLMEYSLSQVRETLLEEGYPREQVMVYIDSTEQALDNLVPDKLKPEYQPVAKNYGRKTKLAKLES